MTVNMLPEFDHWQTDTNGVIAEVLEHFAQLVVIPDSVETLSVPYEGRGNLNPTIYPRERTGDLIASIRALPANVDEQGLHVAVIADAEHNGRPYWLNLRTGDLPGSAAGKLFRFSPDRPYYKFIDVP